MNTKTDTWNDFTIRFIEREPGEWWAIGKDIADALGYAKASGYTPINDFLQLGETIVSTLVFGDVYFALTSQNRLAYVTHWYGNDDSILLANIAIEAEKLFSKSKNHAKATAVSLLTILKA